MTFDVLPNQGLGTADSPTFAGATLSGNLGVGTSTPASFLSGSIGIVAFSSTSSASIRSVITGSGFSAGFTMQSDAALGGMNAFGSATGGTIFGIGRAGMATFSATNNAANGLTSIIYGSVSAAPVYIGTNNLPAISIDTSQRVGIGTIYGGVAAGSALNLYSTLSGSPSGDFINFNASNLLLSRAAGGGTTVYIGNADISGGELVLAGGSSGSQILQTAAAASGTITLPAGTHTLAPSDSPTFTGAVSIAGGSTAALTSTSTFTSGAGASTGTLTNAPAAGNPTSWIKISDNGVTRYIPAW